MRRKSLFYRAEVGFIPHAEHHTMIERREPENYEIKIRGHLDSHWSDWFDGLTMIHDKGGDTILSGPIVDQPALYGVLTKVRDLGLPLLSVNRIEADTGMNPRMAR